MRHSLIIAEQRHKPMTIGSLAHYSVRTDRLEHCKTFYCEALGLRAGYRPDFPFPGIWLYQGENESTYGVVHLIGSGGESDTARDAYLGRTDPSHGTGTLDHIAFIASNWKETRARLENLRMPFRERRVPNLGLHQVFLTDPNGIVIELNYPADEAA